jgi:hypothetical protein
MSGQPTPPLIQEAFAKNANPLYIQNPIPLTTTDATRASFDLGFPPLTMTQIFAGGNPPFGQDVNGILNMLSAHIVAAQAGQPYLFSSTLSAAMGGYAAGAVVGMADGSGLWLNNQAGNTTDPDGGSAAGWLPLYSYGFTAVAVTGGVTTLSRAQFRRGVIVVSGALAGNAQIIMPSGTTEGLRSWLIVNNCSGSFSLTVKTAAGTGVAIPAGGFAGPTEVYGDGTNIYPTVAPITLPTDVNPTANTIALRNNSGYLFATYFNQSSGLENFSMAAVYADAGDGYHRKISLANFAAQISLTQFAGSVAAAQVPAVAVTQYVSLILASAALTGTPTAPTAAVGTASTQVATTAFVNPGSSLAAAGYRKNPDGTIDQWGVDNTGGASVISFPIPFPSTCVDIQAISEANGAVQTWIKTGTVSRFGFQPQTTGGAIPIRWRALGF